MFKRRYLLLIILMSGFLFLAALPNMIGHASPASPMTFVVTQPDGTTFTATQWGDEFMNGLETTEGYTIQQDADSGYWYYVTASLDGSLVPARQYLQLMIVGRDEPEGLKKHLRPPELSVLASAAASTDGINSTNSPSASGTHKVVVLLAGFPDATGRTDPADWASLIFGGVGSLKDYYETVSFGEFSIDPANETSGTANDGVIGWLNLNNWSGDMPEHPNPGNIITDDNKYISKRALQLGDSYINFADYDTDLNGSISSNELHIIVIVAGFERSYTGMDEPAVWAHNGDLSGVVGAPTLDGKVIANASRGGYYNQVGEYHVDHPGTMGVIAHVFGHDINWPDLYDIDLSSYGIGDWSVMGTGAWNGAIFPGDLPAFPSAWEKWYQGWMTPTTISGYSIGQVIPQAETNNSAFLLRPNPTAVDWTYRASSGQGEYFLVENRQLTSYDVSLPGCGLLIWHIDETIRYDNYANANEDHPLVKVMEADGLGEINDKIDEGDAGDPFPGTTLNRNFTLYTTPNSKLYNGTDSFVRVTNISDCGASMTADLLYGYPVPILTSLSPSFSEPSTTGFTLTLYGEDFHSNSVVRWNGSDRTTYYYSSNELKALIPASDMSVLSIGDSIPVTVFNPQPGGGVSSARSFDIIDTTLIVRTSFLSTILKNFTLVPLPGFINKLVEGFEGTFPGYKWEIVEDGTGDYRWQQRDCRPYEGVYSAWSVGGGVDGYPLVCGSNYPNYVDTYMLYGPFSTEEGIINGEVKFKMWLNSETGFDYLWITATGGGPNEWGYKVSGNSGGWITGTLNLNNLDGLGHEVIGLPLVWIRFRFTSDYLVSTGEGAFIDKIVLRVCTSPVCSAPYSPPAFPSVSIQEPTGDLIYEPVIITSYP